MSYTDEQVALCALNNILGYQPKLALSLIEEFGNPIDLFDGSLASYDMPTKARCSAPAEGVSLAQGHTSPGAAGVCKGASPFAQLVPATLIWARKELAKVEEKGFRFIGLNDEDYPEALRECEDPPLGLYLNGSSSPTEIFGLRPMVGIVGTRDISPYGREWCRKIVEALAAAAVQPCIVSGLAFGADGIAHRTALDCGLTTVGVMATGIDSIYPWRHTDLAMDIVRTPGCGLVTDYPMGTAPVALNFLRRNRIIAGLVRGVIVVESKSKGGSLMTARYAVEYSRDVYALPGRADDLRSAGCNSLIAHNMAQLITSPEELVGQLGLGVAVRGAGGSWGKGARSLERVLEKEFGPESAPYKVGLAVRDHRGATADDLAALTGLPIAAVLEGIGLLEVHGIITTDLLRRCALSQAYA